MFGIAVAVVILKKLFYKKNIFNCNWFENIYVLLKLWLQLRLNKK